VPNEILIWYSLSWGADQGYKVYDFGGAGKPDEEYGVRRFKAKFGGELVRFGRNKRVHYPLLLKVSQLGYQLGKRFY
jgi:lipid II:glycine glycyltransferase (peptidoglycan interpeptide bridge formation enzyme)